MTNLATLLTDTAAASPESRAVVLDDKGCATRTPTTWKNQK